MLKKILKQILFIYPNSFCQVTGKNDVYDISFLFFVLFCFFLILLFFLLFYFGTFFCLKGVGGVPS